MREEILMLLAWLKILRQELRQEEDCLHEIRQMQQDYEASLRCIHNRICALHLLLRSFGDDPQATDDLREQVRHAIADDNRADAVEPVEEPPPVDESVGIEEWYYWRAGGGG